MKFYRTFILPLTAIALLGAGCNIQAPKLPDILNRSDDALLENEENIEWDELTVAIGQTFTVEFEGNESSEYRWFAEHSRPNIEFVKDEYVPHEWPVPPDLTDGTAEDGVVGAGGTHYFTFIAVQPGLARIKFTYSKQQSDESALKTVVYEITAK
ncbi:MAG: protease inhibitor I42 family protein [Patescibacteria group bacterium]